MSGLRGLETTSGETNGWAVRYGRYRLPPLRLSGSRHPGVMVSVGPMRSSANPSAAGALSPVASVPRPTGAPPLLPAYELLRQIGAGAYGEVWLARSTTGALRAVKACLSRQLRRRPPVPAGVRGHPEVRSGLPLPSQPARPVPRRAPRRRGLLLLRDGVGGRGAGREWSVFSSR